MKGLQSQVDELKATVDRLARDLARVNVRNASPKMPRHGRWFGKLTGALAQGGSASVRLWWYSSGAWRDSQLSVTAYDWYLNTGETIPAGTKVEVAYKSAIWVVTNAYCDVDDTEAGTASMTAQGGSLSPSLAGPPAPEPDLDFSSPLQAGSNL